MHGLIDIARIDQHVKYLEPAALNIQTPLNSSLVNLKKFNPGSAAKPVYTLSVQ